MRRAQGLIVLSFLLIITCLCFTEGQDGGEKQTWRVLAGDKELCALQCCTVSGI